jgi:hypothetical protein
VGSVRGGSARGSAARGFIKAANGVNAFRVIYVIYYIAFNFFFGGASYSNRFVKCQIHKFFFFLYRLSIKGNFIVVINAGAQFRYFPVYQNATFFNQFIGTPA